MCKGEQGLSLVASLVCLTSTLQNTRNASITSGAQCRNSMNPFSSELSKPRTLSANSCQNGDGSKYSASGVTTRNGSASVCFQTLLPIPACFCLFFLPLPSDIFSEEGADVSLYLYVYSFFEHVFLTSRDCQW